MLPHRFAIADAPQKFEEHHQTTERSHRPLGLPQFHFLPAPKSGNFPVHCFVLLGVSPNQLKHYRARTEQCYLISGFRLRKSREFEFRALSPDLESLLPCLPAHFWRITKGRGS